MPRNKRTGRRKPLRGSTSPSQPNEPEPKPKSIVRRTGAFLFNTARDTAMQYFWAFAAGAITPPVLAMIASFLLYLRSPQSASAYALLKYALIFLAGTLFPLLVLVSLALLDAYRKRRRERDRVHKYTSNEKAWVDFAAEFGPASTRFSELFSAIGEETLQVGTRSQELITAISLPDPKQRLAQTSRRARMLNKNCLRMELAGERLSEAADTFFETAEGLLRSAPSASQGNHSQLLAVRVSLEALSKAADVVITSQNGLIENSKAVHGQVSRDVNTSMNWLVAVCQSNVRLVEGVKSRLLSKSLRLVDQKLNA